MKQRHRQFDSNTLYRHDTKILVENTDFSVYKMKNETGEGVITRYQIFPGIDLLYNDIHMLDGVDDNKLPYHNVMEINHCREGRFECEFHNGGFSYLGAGDLAVNMLTHQTSSVGFPLCHYHGISVMVNLTIASETVNQISNVFGGMPIDLYAMKERLCGDDDAFIMRATDSIEHIFSELYTVQEDLSLSYLKIKVLELFLFLSRDNIIAQGGERHYFSRGKIHVIKEIESYLVKHLEHHITLNELAENYHMSLTSLKTCFKSVYGTSIFAYIRSYRLQQAALMLQQTNLSITEISGSVGYSNASKFSSAFKKEFKLSPGAYRKS